MSKWNCQCGAINPEGSHQCHRCKWASSPGEFIITTTTSPKNQQDGGAPERVWIRFTLAGIHATLSNSEKYGEQSIPYVPASALDQAMALARAEAFEEAAEIVKDELGGDLDFTLFLLKELSVPSSEASIKRLADTIGSQLECAAKAARERGGKVEGE